MVTGHSANWFFGWGSLLAAFLTGIPLGLSFHRDDFWGGYASFPRRVVRLGDVALAALGIVNPLVAVSPWPANGSAYARPARLSGVVRGAAMPAPCSPP